MKYEIGPQKPDNLQEEWPGQFNIFSHFESFTGIPQPLFLITTRKENGKANACFHTWSCFSGDGGGFFAIMPGLMRHTHTYRNILREKEFCVNFIDASHYESCIKTIEHNAEDIDELQDAGFTEEPAAAVKAPRIREAFLSFECTLESDSDLSGIGVNAMIIGRVVHAARDAQQKDSASICSDKSFMYYIQNPADFTTGKPNSNAVAQLRLVREDHTINS